MNKVRFATNISFADSEFESFFMSKSGILTITFKSWDRKKICIKFFNTIRFSFLPGDIVSNFFEVHDSEFLNEAINEYFLEGQQNTFFQHFQIIDIVDFPCMEVVAEKATVEKDE